MILCSILRLCSSDPYIFHLHRKCECLENSSFIYAKYPVCPTALPSFEMQSVPRTMPP